MLVAKVINPEDTLSCVATNIFSVGCFVIGCKYKVHSVSKERVYMLCEGGFEHNVPRRDIGFYFKIPIVIKRNIPKWL